MTYILDGYNISIPPTSIPDSNLRPEAIRWRDEASGNNTRLDFVMRLYAGATIRDLTIGGRNFPSASVSAEEKIAYLRPITRTILSQPDKLEFE